MSVQEQFPIQLGGEVDQGRLVEAAQSMLDVPIEANPSTAILRASYRTACNNYRGIGTLGAITRHASKTATPSFSASALRLLQGPGRFRQCFPWLRLILGTRADHNRQHGLPCVLWWTARTGFSSGHGPYRIVAAGRRIPG